MMQNPYQKIVQQSISTMTPAQLLIALYEKGETELSKAIYFIENKDLPKAHNSIMKAQNIISTLDSSLKTKYEISESLGALYDYMYK
ncbi:MAG: flagellar export chaperone FliS, partial [Oscillospiraceae bacterium]|nr:flagellar export chaperone FliS [Oscillospiraceae bacterium]